MEGLIESLSMEAKPFGIRVCMIEPGDFNTNISRNRIPHRMAPDSPYRDTLTRLDKLATAQVENAENPDRIGPLVNRIIVSKTPRLRYKICSPLERLSLLLKRILPDRIFEKIIMTFYGLR